MSTKEFDPSPEILRQLDEDPGFRALLLRQHTERSALTARHAQEYVQAVLVWRRRNAARAATYAERRAAENRGPCTSCGTSDAECTELVFSPSRAPCCSRCGGTDTHPEGES